MRISSNRYLLSTYYSQEIKYRKIDISTANAEARGYMKDMWTNLENKLALVGGKEFIRCLNGWYKQKFFMNVSVSQIISEFQKDEFDSEIVEIIKNIIL